MRKFKFLTAILSLMVFFGSLTACQFSMVPPSSSSTHTCKSVCPECEKCLDAECEEEACLEKCDCEETSEHTCESPCIICNGCTNEYCEEEACLEKCQGHDTPHTCESECPECGKCEDTECQEEACVDKCQGHHICESICRDCEKCMDAECEEEACAEKCECQATPDPDPAHTCESVCETCGKCEDLTCTEEACADKCQGHTVTPPAHTCESVCETCGKCEDLTCEEEACAEKCEGHTVTPPAHTCESVCETCGKCEDLTCEEEACADKCEGHTVTPPAHTCESVCETCGKCEDLTCEEEACAEKCEGHHTCESVCIVCGKCMDADCTEEVCEEKCQHHICESACVMCGKCEDTECQEEACEAKCEGHTEVTQVSDWRSYELNIISFNVLIPGEKNTISDWYGGRGDAVVNLINTSGADVIGLQEVSDKSYPYIKDRLTSNYEMIYTDTSVQDASIYDKMVFNLLDMEQYYLQKADGTSSGNKATVLMLQHRVTGEKVKAINTHAQHGDSSVSGQRKAEFNTIAQRSLSDKEYKFTIVSGDFNAGLNYSADYASISNKLQNCRETAIESPNRDIGTFPKFGAYANGGSIYDYIFVTESEDVEVLYYEVRQDRWGSDNNYLSDHCPIQAKVRIYNRNHAWSDFY